MLTLSQYDVLMAIKREGIIASQEIYLDQKYVLPNFNWIKNEFSASFRSLKHYLTLESWISEKNDCDNFSCGARFLANTLNKLSTNKSTGLAFGEYYYVLDSGGGHAINFFIHSPTQSLNDLKLDFYEPQNDTVVRLSPTEKENCLGIVV